MSKICPQCRRKQESPAHLGCEKCRVPFVNEDELVKTFTKEELKIIATFLLKDWRVYVVASIGLAIGICLLYWQVHEQIGTQIRKFQLAASNQVAVAYSEATNQLNREFQDFAGQASNQIVSAYASVTNEIAVEFQTPRIKQTVEDVAKGEAKEILKVSVQPEVERFSRDAQFLRLSTRARAYDFKAYQQLIKFEDQTNEDAEFAKQILAEIDRSLEKDRAYNTQLSRRVFMEYSGTNLYQGPFTSDELASFFKAAGQDKVALNREGFVNTASDFKNKLFLCDFIRLLTNEPDLSVADRITVAISQLSNEDFHPHNYEQIKRWWGFHQTEFTNWPNTEFWEGYNEFRLCQYSQAAKYFETVLQIDKSADMSRAMLIACDWELGETNKVDFLAKDFKNPDGRWAKWANAKSELEFGNISSATTHLVYLSTNYPTMSGVPKRGYNIWRKVDWDLFDKLISGK